MLEEWKVISGFEGYSISNYGNVKNNKTGRLLKPLDVNRIYKGVRLRSDNNDSTPEYKMLLVHRLVASAFNNVDDMDNYNIRHIDGDFSNNNLDNLEFTNRRKDARDEEQKRLIVSMISNIRRWINNNHTCDENMRIYMHKCIDDYFNKKSKIEYR